MASSGNPSAVPVSVHVLTYNSGTTLARALQSVGSVAEIIVMDGGSNDDTLSIAERFGARILPQKDGISGPITDFSAIRNRALLASTQPWIFSLDSDEIVSPALREEIAQIATSRIPGACLVPRMYLTEEGEIINFASTYPNERVYLFHRAAVTRWIKPVHERVELVPGMKLRRLQSPCLAPLPTPEEFRRKNERYIRIEVASSQNDGWMIWLKKRLWRTLRGRAIALIRLAQIWLWAKPGKKLPLEHEKLRFWYAWRLVMATRPSAVRSAAKKGSV